MSPTAHLGWRLRPLSGCTARPRACRGAPVPPRQTLPSSSVCHRQRPWTSLWDSTGPAPLGGLCPPTQGERAGDGSQHANLPSWLPRKRCLRTAVHRGGAGHPGTIPAAGGRTPRALGQIAQAQCGRVGQPRSAARGVWPCRSFRTPTPASPPPLGTSGFSASFVH